MKHLSLIAVIVAAAGMGLLSFSTEAQVLWWGQYQLQTEYTDSSFGEHYFAEHSLYGQLTLPVLDYRVGRISVGLGTYFLQTRRGSESSSALGVGHRSINVNLFPHRNFPVTLYYQRDERPEMLEFPGWTSEHYGIRLNVRRSKTGIWWFNLDQKRYHFGERRERRQFLSIYQNRRIGEDIQEYFEWESERWSLRKNNAVSHRGTFELRSDSTSGRRWYAVTYFDHQSADESRATSITEDLFYEKEMGERWRLLGHGSLGLTRADYLNQNRVSLSASLHYDLPRYRLFGGLMTSTLDTSGTDAPAFDTEYHQGFAGITWYGPSRWMVTGDLSLGVANQPTAGNGYYSLNGPSYPESSGGLEPIRTIHLGVSKGTDLPQWVSSLAYSFHGLSFERRLYEAFPPGYSTPELESARDTHHQHYRQGSTQFSADYYHSRTGSSRQIDSFSATGALDFNSTISLRLTGDWYRVQGGFSGDLTSTSAYLSSQYRSKLGFSLGFFATYAKHDQGESLYSPNQTRWLHYDTNTVGLTFSSVVLGKIPVNLFLQRIESDLWGIYYSARLTWDMNVRDLNLRFLYSYDREEDETFIHRFRIDLLRLFRGNSY